MELSVVEQRYRAVLAVLAGESVTSVAAEVGVSRQTVHKWLSRYRDDGLGGLMDRPCRPLSSPWQSPAEVEAAVCELRREHPRWGPRRLAFELGRSGMEPVPSRMTVYRILVRHGLVEAKARGRRREDYKRWERDAPIALWRLPGDDHLPGRDHRPGVHDTDRGAGAAQTVAKVVEQGAETAGLDVDIASHTGRRTVITTLYVEGAEALEDIGRVVRQATSETTAGHVKRLGRRPRSVAERARGAGDRSPSSDGPGPDAPEPS